MPLTQYDHQLFMAAQVPVMDMMKNKQVKSDGSSTAYYKIPQGATDLLDLIEHKKMSFGIGNVFKACYRLGEKADCDALYDINKILFFAEREKQNILKGMKHD